jgi:tetratricopeptide (TPR) repeat protein
LFEFETLPPLTVKGREPPVQAYRLMGSKALREPARGIAGLRSPLVGRDAELARLYAAIEALREGRGGALAIVGEAGQGKSRLVAEARQGLADDLTWVEGRALSYMEGMSYRMARDVLARLLGVSADAPPAEIETALRAGVRDRFPDREAEVYPYLARLMELPTDEATTEILRYLVPEALQRRMLRAYGDYTRARTLERPLVLVWEDLHWADPSSLQVLETLVSFTGEAPLLVLLVFRPEEGRAAEFHERMSVAHADRYAIIDLSPLSRDDSARLLENLLQVENLPQSTRHSILDKAEGNAFFLEEVLRSLIDAGLVVLQGGRAVARGDVAAIDVPDTLQGVIAARIDRLPAEEKRTLQTASVIGRVFQERVLAYLLEAERAAARLGPSLAELLRRELIRLRAPAVADTALDCEYIFKHAVTQDVTYDSLLHARRRELHRIIGEAIETLFADQVDELAATLGYHYARAEEREKAVHFLSRAADRARTTYANREAIDFTRAAIEQLRRLGEEEAAKADAARKSEVDLQESLGDILDLLDRHEEARLAFQAALELVPPADRVARSRMHRKSAGSFRGPKIGHLQHRYEEALKAFEAAEVALGSDAGDASSEWHREWLDVQISRMHLCYWRNDVDGMARLVEKTRQAMERHASPGQRADFFSCQVLMAFRRDRYVISDETLSHARSAADAAPQAEQSAQLGWPAFVLGFTHLWRGDMKEAEELLRDTLGLTERTGDVMLQMLCLTYLTITYRKKGMLPETREYAERSLEAASGMGMSHYVGMAQATRAWLALREGDEREAEALCREAVEMWGKLPTPHPFEWAARWPMIGVAVSRDDMPAAFEQARGLLADHQQPPPGELGAAVEAAVAAWESGRADAARALLAEAMGPARVLGYL